MFCGQLAYSIDSALSFVRKSMLVGIEKRSNERSQFAKRNDQPLGTSVAGVLGIVERRFV